MQLKPLAVAPGLMSLVCGVVLVGCDPATTLYPVCGGAMIESCWVQTGCLETEWHPMDLVGIKPDSVEARIGEEMLVQRVRVRNNCAGTVVVENSKSAAEEIGGTCRRNCRVDPLSSNWALIEWSTTNRAFITAEGGTLLLRVGFDDSRGSTDFRVHYALPGETARVRQGSVMVTTDDVLNLRRDWEAN